MAHTQDNAARQIDAPPNRARNRARILAAARQGLRDDPDASLDSIARAAGLATRTLYGHFANRQALSAMISATVFTETCQPSAHRSCVILGEPRCHGTRQTTP